MAAMLMPASVQAKKIKYGTMILYDGKVKKDVPTGEGTLTTTCGIFTDVLVGNFVGDGTVTDAQLKFPSGWKFQGSLSYEVEIDGSKVTYKLTEGELYVISASVYKSNVKDFTLKIVPKSPVTLVRTPQGSKIDLKKFVYDTTIPGALVYDDFPAPLSLKDFGDKNTATSFANCTILPTSKVSATSGTGTDPLRNLQEKEFAGVTEPWTFLVRPEEVIMADGTKIMVFDEDEDKSCSVTYPSDEEIAWRFSNTNKNGTVYRLIKKYADNSVLYINMEEGGKDSPWNIIYPDKSKAKGDIRFNGKKLKINATKTLANYTVKEVFDYVMQESSFENLGAKLYSGTLTKPDGTVVNYRRGHSEADFIAVEENRQKALDEGTSIPVNKLEVFGQWRMKNKNQPFGSYSYYTLTIDEDNNTMLKLTTDYYATYATQYETHPYYVRNEQTISGTYTLSGENIIFKWNKSSKNDSGMNLMFECHDSFPKALRNKAEQMSSYFDDMVAQLSSAKVSNISNSYITLKEKYTFSRYGDEDAETLAAHQQREQQNRLDIGQDGYIQSFKHIYNDGVITIEGGKMTIEYANGDRYVGVGHAGVIDSRGKMPGSDYDDKFSEYKEFTNAVVNIDNISDLEVYYHEGTLTKVDGTTLTFTKGLTEKQNDQILQNIGKAVDLLNEMGLQKLKDMKQKSMETKKKLLEEGFAPYYVNSIFDNFRILEGTPKALIDRAIQLGCHITRHPVIMSDVHFDLRKSGETYAMVVTNYNTGADAFEGFVKFHWNTKRAIYVGREVR